MCCAVDVRYRTSVCLGTWLARYHRRASILQYFDMARALRNIWATCSIPSSWNYFSFELKNRISAACSPPREVRRDTFCFSSSVRDFSAAQGLVRTHCTKSRTFSSEKSKVTLKSPLRKRSGNGQRKPLLKDLVDVAMLDIVGKKISAFWTKEM